MFFFFKFPQHENNAGISYQKNIYILTTKITNQDIILLTQPATFMLFPISYPIKQSLYGSFSQLIER